MNYNHSSRLVSLERGKEEEEEGETDAHDNNA